MARIVTLVELRTAVQRRGGVENSYDLTEAVLNEFLNSAAAELWDILRRKGDDLLVTAATLTTSPGDTAIALPDDFYKERLLWIQDSSSPSGWRKMLPFTLDEAHRFGPASDRNYRYRLQGAASIILSAATPVVETFRLFYVPCSPVMVADNDELDGLNGYDELVVMMAWRKCVERQRLDTSGADREIARLMARVSSASDGRSAEPFSLVPRGLRSPLADDLEPWW